MANKQDEQSMELVGKIGILAFKYSPFWIPIGLIALFIWKPEKFHELFGPYYPEIRLGIIIIVLTFIVAVIFLTCRFLINRTREKKHYEYYRLLPNQDQSSNSAAIHEMVEQIAGYKRPRRIRLIRGREWFQWLVHRDDEGIKFYIGFPQDRKTGILRTIKNAYPEAEIHKADEVQFPSASAYSGRMVMDYKGIHEVKPLASFNGKNGIGNLISYMEAGTWIDITFSPSSPYKLMSKIRKSQKKMKKFHSRLSEMDSFQKADLKSVTKRLSGRDKVFTVSVSVASDAKQGGGVVHSIATTIGSIMNDENGLSLRRFKKAVEKSPYPFLYKMDWIGRELANMLVLPSPEHEIFESVQHLQKGERALAPNEMTKGISVGYMKHPVIKGRLVSIPDPIFTEHWALTGKTGAGKSSEILMILQSMIDRWAKKPESAPGFTLFDPARDTALTVLSRLIKAEHDGATIPWEKVHYISLTHEEYPLALNLLHKTKAKPKSKDKKGESAEQEIIGESTDQVKNNIMAILDTAFNNDGAPKMRRWIENAIAALLESDHHSILGVNRMFQDAKFRESVVRNIKDPLLKAEWKSYNFKDSDPTLDAIKTRMAPFQNSMYMRRMFGQTKFGLNIRKWMDEGHIVMIDMKNVDDINIALTVGHMVTQYHQTAINRPAQSKIHMVLVDEAHLCQIPVMDTIIAFDRKFGLSLGITTQYLDQLKPFLKKAITGNMATILSATQGSESAKQIEDITDGRFSASYLQGLPSNTVAVFTKEKVGKKNKITTVTVETEPPYLYKENGEVSDYSNPKEMSDTLDWLEKFGLGLQKRDGIHYKKVDEKVSSYLGLTEKEDTKVEGFFEIPNGNDILRGDAIQENTEKYSNEESYDDLFSLNTPPRKEESDIMDKDKMVSEVDYITEMEANETTITDETDESKNEKNSEEGGEEEKVVSLF